MEGKKKREGEGIKGKGKKEKKKGRKEKTDLQNNLDMLIQIARKRLNDENDETG